MTSASEYAAAGVTALQRGDSEQARANLQQALARGARDAQTFFALAIACFNLNDYTGVHSAVDGVLQTEPHNVRAMLMKADCYAAQKNARAAASYYKAVVGLAPDVDRLPPDIASEIRRASAACEQYAGEMLDHLRAVLATEGYNESTSSKRVTDSLKMLAGVIDRYEEAPKSYYFPGLPAQGYYDRGEFDWTERLEKQTAAIADELSGVMSTQGAFEPYVQAEQDRPNLKQHKLLNSRDWTALYLWRNGEIVEENAKLFPKTLAALEDVPMDRAIGRAPMALFSKLTPGAHIAAHTGLINTRLICHLPVIAPTGCELRVGNEKRHWNLGETLIFNDTIEHEAWNNSREERVVLLFSVWRPEMSEEERRLAAAVLSAAVSLSSGAA